MIMTIGGAMIANVVVGGVRVHVACNSHFKGAISRVTGFIPLTFADIATSIVRFGTAEIVGVVLAILTPFPLAVYSQGITARLCPIIEIDLQELEGLEPTLLGDREGLVGLLFRRRKI